MKQYVMGVLLVLSACGEGGSDSDPATTPKNTFKVSLTVGNGGSVAGLGTPCQNQCSEEFDEGTSIQLSAQPDNGFVFSGWFGTCEGSGACNFTLLADTQVSATFAAVADTQKPNIEITSPTRNSTFNTQGASIDLDGTAADNIGIAQVSWLCTSGCTGSGAATGTEHWSIDGIALNEGNNIIETTAFDAAGNSATDTIAITRRGPTGGLTLQVIPYPTLADRTLIPVNTITGYDLFSINQLTGTATFYASNSGEDNTLFSNLPAGRYAARINWAGGRTALSLPVNLGAADWKTQLAPPSPENTFDATEVEQLNTCLAASGINKVCYMSSSAGDFQMTANGVFIDIRASGTGSDDRITLMAVPGETVRVVGNWNGADPKTDDSFNDQRIIRISGDWARVYGLDLSYSNRYGIEVNASYAHIEENTIHNTWSAGILINDPGALGHTSHSIIQYNDIHHVANSTGIWLVFGKGDTHAVDNNLIKGNLLWRNGFLADNTESKTEPGNADGIGLFKGCDEAYDENIAGGGWLDASVTGRENQCRNNKLVRNIAIWNADDCFDISSGEGTLLVGNLAANCGDEGNRGFKVYPNIAEKITWINNVAIHQNPNFSGSGSSWGFEVNANSPDVDPSRSFGRHDFIGNVGIHNDSASSNVNFTLESYDFGSAEANGDLYNNVSGLGGSDRLSGSNTAFNQGTNHWQNISNDGTPDLIDNAYELVSETFTGATVRERWYNKYNAIVSHIMARKNGNLYNNGTYLPEFYQSNPADHPTDPSNSDSDTQSYWFAGEKTDPTPDKGVGYRYMHAPFLNVVP